MENIFEGYLLVSDMDGTLLNSEKRISNENLNAIDYFVSEGGKFTVATGRMVQSVEQFINQLKMELPAILHNGAKIYDYKNNKIIAQYPIEEDRKEVFERIKKDKPHIGIEIFAEEVVYIYRSCERTKRYEKHEFDIVYNMPEEVWKKEWLKVLLIGDKKELDELEKEYKSVYDKGTVFRSGANFLDVVSNKVSKGKALEKLIKIHNIDPEKVIAIGDNMNDIEMLERANYGFYIKNGEKRALENAKYIAPSNDDNPIAYVVNWIKDNVINNKN